MSTQGSAWHDMLVEHERHQAERAVSLVIPLVAVAALLPLRALPGGLPVPEGLPINTLAAALLVGIALCYPAKHEVQLPGISWTAVILVVWLGGSSYFLNDIAAPRRLGNLVILLLIAGVIGSGRLHVRSLRTGVLIGLFGASLVGILTLGSSSYEGRLTSWMGDPNATGYTLVAMGLACAQTLEKQRHRWILLACLAVPIGMTLSRTTFFATVVAVLWIIVSPRFPMLVNSIGLAGTMWLYSWADRYVEARGWFSDRQGSDNLRDRLLVIEKDLVEQAGWTGNGLGTAIAEVQEGFFLFFHNSYLALRAEGGTVAYILLWLFIVGLFATMHALPGKYRPVWAEAGVLAGFICSVNVGFSLTQPALAVAIGLYIYHHCLYRDLRRARGEDVSALPVAYQQMFGVQLQEAGPRLNTADAVRSPASRSEQTPSGSVDARSTSSRRRKHPWDALTPPAPARPHLLGKTTPPTAPSVPTHQDDDSQAEEDPSPSTALEADAPEPSPEVTSPEAADAQGICPGTDDEKPTQLRLEPQDVPDTEHEAAPMANDSDAEEAASTPEPSTPSPSESTPPDSESDCTEDVRDETFSRFSFPALPNGSAWAAAPPKPPAWYEEEKRAAQGQHEDDET